MNRAQRAQVKCSSGSPANLAGVIDLSSNSPGPFSGELTGRHVTDLEGCP
jgi:hypothetical protein